MGELTELEVTMALMRAGKRLLKPISASCRYDLAIDDDGILTRIQCKTGVLRGGRVVFRLYSINASQPRARTYRGEVDAFGVYCRATATCYLVPMSAVAACDTMAALRVVPSGNGQVRGIRRAADFVIIPAGDSDRTFGVDTLANPR